MHNYIIVTCQIKAPLDWSSWIDNFCRVMFDVWVVATLSFFVTRLRIKPAIMMTYITTLIWSFANVVYSRFFFQFLSFSSVCETGALTNGLVFNSFLAELRLVDMYYPISIVCFLLLLRNSRMLSQILLFKYLKRSLIIFLLLFLINISAHIVLCAFQPELRYWSYFSRRVWRRMFGNDYLMALPVHAHFLYGSIKSIAIEASLSLHSKMELSDKQKFLISQVVERSKNTMVNDKRQCVKNVIFILVESQMSFVIDKKVDGREVTPNLNKLKKSPSVYYNGGVKPNITLGESSDGQYIYMTGLLPLRSMITVTMACKRFLPGLPRQLRKIGIANSRMIIPTPSSLWRQDEMCHQYGFNRLYTSYDYLGDHEQTLTDEQVFELASRIDADNCDEPFFSIVLTASMHQPYLRDIDSSFRIKDKTIKKELKYYLNACHYTDRAIGNYLEWLKEKELYNGSLIIIASDHHVHSVDFGEGFSDNIPLFIINGNMGKTAYNGPCNQVDVYTTIMDILSVPNSWSGVGSSLLNPKYKKTKGNLSWDVSEWILLSDYSYQ